MLFFFTGENTKNATNVFFFFFRCSLMKHVPLWSGEYDLKSGPQGQSSFPGLPAGLGCTKAPLSSMVKKLWSPHRAIPVADKIPGSITETHPVSVANLPLACVPLFAIKKMLLL